MRIKRVVVQGFKTFAHKTEFEFDPGITAIVGPNGSGKSNVVDAIRWCMGEQSFSLIRSKKTSDVIFSGSDKRARLGMAQVSLTLDNSDGELPIDFAEVEISRRAYRDGDNEYYINGQRVRLLDVNELLSHTGLGKRTYAVVGQGLIDKVLSLSPEERRVLFEEAAGITSYQSKRTKTIRQLDATQQNLTRVYDIIAELSPRLKYLKRQADRAREREQIANDLRDMLRIWYGYRWHTTLHQLEENQKSEAELKKSVAARQKSLAKLGSGIENLRGKQGELRQKLSQLHSEASVLHSKAEAIGRDLAVSQERLRQTQERQEEAQRELAPLHLQKETLTQRQSEVEMTLAAALSVFTDRRGEVDALQFEVNKRQEERARLQNSVEVARQQLSQLQNQRADIHSRITQIGERRESIHTEIESQEKVHRQAAIESKKIASDVEAADAKITHHEAEIAKLQKELTRLEKTASALRLQLRAAEEERQQADRTADLLQTRYDLLQRLRNEGAGYASGVRAVLQASQEDVSSGQGSSQKASAKKSRQKQLSGIIGTVATLFQVPSTLDKAIETALGGAFQSVVTESWANARAAIDFLKESGRGRATFLPLDRLNVLPKIVAPKQDGILGNAADLIDFEPDLEDVAHSLLGRVWIAEDLPAARRALDTLRSGPRPTVVTIGGEIVRPGGAVTGGRDSRRRDDSVLAREREFRALPQQIEAAKKAAAKAAATCGEISGQIEQESVRVEQNQQLLADLMREERQQRRAAEEVRRMLDRAEQTVRWQNERVALLKAELAQLDERETKHLARVKELEERQWSAKEALMQSEAAAEAASATDLLQNLADLRAAAAEAQGHLRSQETLKENQLRALQSTTDQIRAKEARIANLGSEIEKLNQHIKELSRQEEQLSQEIAVYQQKIEPAEAELGEFERSQSTEEAREREFQRVLRKDETTWNAAQLRLQRTEDTLTQLRYDIEQDFGLVALEQSDDLAYQPPLPFEAAVEQLPVVKEIPEELEDEVKEMRARLSRVNNVNPDAPQEYDEAAGRHEFLLSQSADLESAAEDLRKVIKELDELMEVELSKTFKAVSLQFVHFFKLLFNGGTAKLVLTEPNDINNTGVEIVARPPGKRPQSLALLSGGERSLSACALIFAILQVSPTPFCVLDEVDAALDEANVDRFRHTVETLTDSTQFIIVTHNRRTLEGANTIYGITMGDDGVSRMIGLRLDGDKIVQSNGSGDAAELKEVEKIVQM